MLISSRSKSAHPGGGETLVALMCAIPETETALVDVLAAVITKPPEFTDKSFAGFQTFLKRLLTANTHLRGSCMG
jgi:hypothetical protein